MCHLRVRFTLFFLSLCQDVFQINFRKGGSWPGWGASRQKIGYVQRCCIKRCDGVCSVRSSTEPRGQRWALLKEVWSRRQGRLAWIQLPQFSPEAIFCFCLLWSPNWIAYRLVIFCSTGRWGHLVRHNFAGLEVSDLLLVGSDGKESACNAEDPGSIPGLFPWKSPWKRKWQPTPVFLSGEFHGAWWATVFGVTKSWTQLSQQHW